MKKSKIIFGLFSLIAALGLYLLEFNKMTFARGDLLILVYPTAILVILGVTSLALAGFQWWILSSNTSKI